MPSKESNLLGYEAVQSIESLLGTCFHAGILLGFDPKMEAICSSETVKFQRTAQRHIAEDSTLHNHRCENLKSYIPMVYLVLKQPYSFFARFFYLHAGTLICVVYNEKCCFMINNREK
jgi:hypothetical protein